MPTYVGYGYKFIYIHMCTYAYSLQLEIHRQCNYEFLGTLLHTIYN